MSRLLQPLWLVLIAATDREVARMVEYLRAENRILRERLPARLTVTPRERARLVKLGRPLGATINGLITIVTPRTFARWISVATATAKPKISTRKLGRPRTADDIRDLILRLARESGRGYSRVLGELKKLGIRSVSRTTVTNILREAGLDPGPKRGEGTWDEFLKRQAATLWACDFLSVKSWTTRGLVDLYILFFLHVGSRRVFVSGVTAHPDAAWVTQQARNASMVMAEWNLPATHPLLDHDAKFASGFDAVFEAEGVIVKRVGPRAPRVTSTLTPSGGSRRSGRSASTTSSSLVRSTCGTWYPSSSRITTGSAPSSEGQRAAAGGRPGRAADSSVPLRRSAWNASAGSSSITTGTPPERGIRVSHLVTRSCGM